MRGNGINVLRIAPYSAVQFSTYEFLKSAWKSSGREIDTTARLVAGSLAGIASVVSTYPLDLVRSRLSIEVSPYFHRLPAFLLSGWGDEWLTFFSCCVLIVFSQLH